MMMMILNALALAAATPAAAQATEPAHSGHSAPATTGKTMPAHDAMMADGKMKPDAAMMERCKKMHAAMMAKSGTTPDSK
jgi:hypothetical protein